MDEKKRDVIEEGFQSFRLNDGALRNPYPKDSQDYNDFERGWIQAQKRSADTGSSNTSMDNSMASKYGEMKRGRRDYVESSYNSYATAKGKE